MVLSLSFSPFFFPQFPNTPLLVIAQDKLDGKQLAPEVWETGIVAVGSLVGKLCQQKLCGLQVGPLQTPTFGFFGPSLPLPEVPKMPPVPPLILFTSCKPRAGGGAWGGDHPWGAPRCRGGA